MPFNTRVRGISNLYLRPCLILIFFDRLFGFKARLIPRIFTKNWDKKRIKMNSISTEFDLWTRRIFEKIAYFNFKIGMYLVQVTYTMNSGISDKSLRYNLHYK